MEQSFQKRPLQERIALYALRQQQFGATRPGAVFIVLEPTKGQAPLTGLRMVYAIDGSHMIHAFTYELRKRMNMAPSQSLFLYVRGSYAIMPNRTIADVHRDYVNAEDGFLYISYCREHVFGAN